MRSGRTFIAVTVALAAAALWCPHELRAQPAAPLRPPGEVRAADHPWDGGDRIDVTFLLSPDEPGDAPPAPPVEPEAVPDDPAQSPEAALLSDEAAPDDDPRFTYVIERAAEPNGLYTEVDRSKPSRLALRERRMTRTIEGNRPLRPYYFRVRAIGPDGRESPAATAAEPAVATLEWFDGGRLWLAIITAAISIAVIAFILLARSGMPLYIRRIAGLEAVDEAVGRATEMGRSCLFVPGIQDINDIQTIAGITVLSRVAKVAAEYDAKVEVPTSRALVMTTARETVQSAFLAAGRPEAFSQDLIYYVTDEQFGYVAYLSGLMVREKPAACFYMGSFFAESLILAETGNAVGAIQVAGTAQPAQLPFFVAACDYTLIGEEFFAASAYLSGDPDQLGSLKGQDFGKLIVAALLLVGCGLATWMVATDSLWAEVSVNYVTDVILR